VTSSHQTSGAAIPITVLGNVERIEPPSPSIFLTDYVLCQKPVIIRNLFEDQPIRAINTIERAREQLSELQLDIQLNYMKSLLEIGIASTPRKMTLSQYLDLIQANPGTKYFCVEYPTPDKLAALFRLPDYCKLRDETDVVSNTFVASANNYAHLHYDGDQRDVLMYQVFGVKRYVIIHPRETRKLAPLLDSNIQRTSSIFLENFSEDDKAAFLSYANAYDCVLFPGETLFLPMMTWHYVEYSQTSMSVNFRLGRNKYNRFLAESLPISSVFVQGIAIKLINEKEVQDKYETLFAQIEAACQMGYKNERHRARCLSRKCLEIYDKLYPDSGLPYTIGDARQRKIIALQAERLDRESEGVSRSGPRSVPPIWVDSDRPELAVGVRILSSLVHHPAERKFCIARNDRLEAELSPDPGAPWLSDLLVCLSKQEGLTISALAKHCKTEPSSIRQVLSELYLRDWVVRQRKAAQ
jgi:hypothetical protein